ncbi:MAG TPA: hypothetical protein VHO69_09575 [Phototrophicaceae bacterium]|nr:hypothetical protein [Phototrophicaceae bacterium]
MAKSLIDYVQAHERMWGTEKYTGRPALAEILQAPVVAFWIDKNIAGGAKTNYQRSPEY